MTQRRKSKKTEAEPRRVNRRTFLAGAGAAACVGAGAVAAQKNVFRTGQNGSRKQPVENLPCLQASGGPYG